MLRTARGRLKLSFSRKEAEWLEGEQRKPLAFLSVEDHARFVSTTPGRGWGRPAMAGSGP